MLMFYEHNMHSIAWACCSILPSGWSDRSPCLHFGAFLLENIGIGSPKIAASLTVFACFWGRLLQQATSYFITNATICLVRWHIAVHSQSFSACLSTDQTSSSSRISSNWAGVTVLISDRLILSVYHPSLLDLPHYLFSNLKPLPFHHDKFSATHFRHG